VSWLRILAVVHALSLMIGEAYRTWGANRPAAFWLDDMLAGALLIAGAVAVGKPTPARRALFTGGWGVCVGMLYGSFFGKVFAPQRENAGNFDLGVLTALIGLALATAVFGFVASLVVVPKTP
jgi:hypothetical protein